MIHFLGRTGWKLPGLSRPTCLLLAALVPCIPDAHAASRAAANCAAGNVTIASDLKSAQVSIANPSGGQASFEYGTDPALVELVRETDPSMKIVDGRLVIDPSFATVAFQLQLDQQPRKIDRQYTSTIRFGDGSLGLLSSLFAASLGEEPICWSFRNRDRSAAIFTAGQIQPEEYQLPLEQSMTYLFFGRLDRDEKDAGLLLVDRLVAPWARNAVREAVLGASSLYQRELGPLLEPFTTVVVQEDRESEGMSYGGDALQGLLVIRLSGSGWESESDSARALLDQVVGHEVFHQWNGFGLLPEGGVEGLLALEGGAELASIFWQFRSGRMSKPGFASALSDLYNDCNVRAHASRPLAAAIAASPGRSVYDCGAFAFYSATVGPGVDVARAHQRFFDAWRTAWRESARRYTLHGLLQSARVNEDGQADRIIRSMRNANSLEQDLLPLVRSAGFVVSPGLAPSERTRKAIAALAVQRLMQEDCQGRYGLFTDASSVTLDGSVSCDSLPRSATITRIEGISVVQEAAEMMRRATQGCRDSKAVTVDFLDAPSVKASCSEGMPAVPALVDLQFP